MSRCSTKNAMHRRRRPVVLILRAVTVCLSVSAAAARADETVLSGLDWMTGFPATWNAGAPKVVSDGLHTYAALAGFNGDPYSWSIVRKRGLESVWQQGGPVFKGNQPPVLVLDRKGRLNVFDNTPQLRHLRFDHPAVDVSSYQVIPFPFSGQTGYLYAGYDAASDTLMVVFSETSTWTVYFTALSGGGAWTTPTALPAAPAASIDLYARATRSSGGYSVVTSEHPVGPLNAAYVAVTLFQSASPTGPWTRRDIYRVYGINQGIPYQNFVFGSDLQLDPLGRNRVLLHLNEDVSGHPPRPEGLYIAREEDNYQLRHVGSNIDDAFPLHIDPSGPLFAFAQLIGSPGTVSFRSDDVGLTWGTPQPLSADSINPVMVGPKSGSLPGGKEFGLIYSAPPSPPFNTVRYTTVPLSLPDSAGRFDFWRWGADGTRDYVRGAGPYQDQGGRSYYYTYDYHPDGTFTVSGSYVAGSFQRFYVAHSNGAVRYTDSDGFVFVSGPPEPFSCNALETPLAPTWVNGYGAATSGLPTPRWRWEPGARQCGPIRSWLVCPSWGACVTLNPWASEFEASTLGPGTYTISVQAQNEYGQGPKLEDSITVCPYGTSGCQAAPAGVVRVAPLKSDGTAGTAPVEAIRFKLEILENEPCGSARSMVASIRSRATPARDSYFVEPGLHGRGVAYTDGTCGTASMCGNGSCGVPTTNGGSLRVSVLDSILQGKPGVRTSDPLAFPRQTYGIESGTSGYRTELVSQSDVMGKVIDVVLQKGPAVSSSTGWRFCPLVGQGSTCSCPWGSVSVPCSQPELTLAPEPYRQWDVSVTFGGRTYSMNVALPEADGQLGVLEALVGSGLGGRGVFRAQVWEVEARSPGSAEWERVADWRVTTRDGYGVDFGVKKVTIDGQERIEVKAGLPDTYYGVGQNFSIGPPGRPSLVSPSGVVTANTPTYRWGSVANALDYYLWVDGPDGSTVVQQWYAASAVCSAGSCSATPSAVLTDGAYRFWVQGRNAGGVGRWSLPMDFTVTLPLPGIASLLAPSGTISSSTPVYQWTAASDATDYYLWVNGPSGIPVIQQWYSGASVCSVQACTASPSTILINGAHLFWIQARNSFGKGAWSASLAFTVAVTAKASMTSPPPGSTLGKSTVTFTWTAGAGVSEYSLAVGSSLGAGDIYSGSQGTALTRTVTGLPTAGQTLFVRLGSRISGAWQYYDYTYTAATIVKAVMTSPAPGATLAGSSATFSWTAGTNLTAYWLEVGSTPGGTELAVGSRLTVLSTTVNGLPVNGSTLYVRLWSEAGAGNWLYNDYTYRAATTSSSKAVLQSPTPGSMLAGSTVSFTWSAGSGVTSYWLQVGTMLGGSNVYPGANTTALSATVSGLPVNGSTVYLRLWSLINGSWVYNDYSYTAAAASKAVLLTPSPGSTLTGSTVTFTWSAGTRVTSYWIEVGTMLGGNDIYPGFNTTALSATVGGLPTNGSTAYVRLWSLIAGAWQYGDYTYRASGP